MKIITLFSITTALILLTHCNKKEQPSTVKITITKLRTRTDLAKKLTTLMQDTTNAYYNILLSNDSLATFKHDTNTIMSVILPNTYIVYKGTAPRKVLLKIIEEGATFWNSKRKAQAQALGYTPQQIVTLASIVEEETNEPADKGNVASTYINRLKQGMKLEADPTLKYAINDFSITRITFKHRDAAATSPYSTYANKGLPPGPICTPALSTIDAVLTAPSTNYIFFVAQPNFSGLSNFTADYKQHLLNGQAYHKFLDSLEQAKKKGK